jgi:hypothetical protein
MDARGYRVRKLRVKPGRTKNPRLRAAGPSDPVDDSVLGVGQSVSGRGYSNRENEML